MYNPSLRVKFHKHVQNGMCLAPSLRLRSVGSKQPHLTPILLSGLFGLVLDDEGTTKYGFSCDLCTQTDLLINPRLSVLDQNNRPALCMWTTAASMSLSQYGCEPTVGTNHTKVVCTLAHVVNYAELGQRPVCAHTPGQ